MDIVRVFLRGVKIREVSTDPDGFHAILDGVVVEYPDFAKLPHMIEIEDLDLPLMERFQRFGTDAGMMVNPFALDGPGVN